MAVFVAGRVAGEEGLTDAEEFSSATRPATKTAISL